MKTISAVSLAAAVGVLGALVGYFSQSVISAPAEASVAQMKVPTPDALDARYQRWYLHCEGREGACELSSPLRQQGVEMGSLMLKRNGQGAQLILRTPLGVDIPQGVTLSLEGAETTASQHLSITRCDAIGCLSTLALPQPVYASLSSLKGISAKVQAMHNGSSVTLAWSLAGLAPAIQALNQPRG